MIHRIILQSNLITKDFIPTTHHFKFIPIWSMFKFSLPSFKVELWFGFELRVHSIKNNQTNKQNLFVHIAYQVLVADHPGSSKSFEASYLLLLTHFSSFVESCSQLESPSFNFMKSSNSFNSWNTLNETRPVTVE